MRDARYLPPVALFTLSAFLLASGCGAPAGEPGEAWPAGADDVLGASCLDVGMASSLRACRTEAGQLSMVDRPTAPLEIPGGWRCGGGGSERRCRPRADLASPFVCSDADHCAQRYPYMPDAGQWQCVDQLGVVICKRLAPAAGVARYELGLGWTCLDSLCSDVAPDLPDTDGGWVCRYSHQGGERRTCSRNEDAGDVCRELGCLPPLTPPVCWQDVDCNEATCRRGQCS